MKDLFLIICILLLMYYSYFLIRILKGLGKLSLPPQKDNHHYFVSVIIPFRNESNNILNSLASIEKLNYPDDEFEVIYVDDNSTDNSFELITSEKKRSNIRILQLTDKNSTTASKKRAIQYGIENSKGDIIVTTDADCIHHKNWLKNLVSCFDNGTAFVSGPVEFISNGNLFSEIQKTEFEGLVLAGAGLIGSGSPAICNGANVAYKKSAYLEAGGLTDNLHISSGDDVFLMQKISRLQDHRVKFCCSREAVVFTGTNSTIRNFINQRKRWAGKSLNYENKNLILRLILIFLFYCSLVLQLILALSGNSLFFTTLALSLFIKILLEFLIIKKGEALLFPKNQFSVFLITEILQVPYIIIAAIAGSGGHFTWKDRKIKL